MRYTNKHSGSAGFTLIEMLVISPLVLLLIGGIITLVLSLVGDVSVSLERSRSVSDIQSALDTVERDVNIGFALNQTTGTVPNKQGLHDDTTAFTRNSSTIIVAQYATIKNPYEPDRTLAYTQSPNACGSPTVHLNSIVVTQVVYYVRASTLYRRVIVPNTPVCGGNIWQRNSCTNIGDASYCAAKDEKLLDNASVTIQYFGPDVNAPTTARVTLSTARDVAGVSFTSSGALRASIANN